MAPSFCVEPGADECRRLLEIARASIRSGLDSDRAIAVDASELASSLLADCAVFVTLTQNGALRGCVGSLEASTPLAQAVADAAFNAAFRDRRFERLQAPEILQLNIEISILSEMLPLAAATRQQLLDSLQPGRDGLLLEERSCRATFLPKVWDKIATPDEFFAQLLQKAGLPGDYWSDSMRTYRYHCLSFAED